MPHFSPFMPQKRPNESCERHQVVVATRVRKKRRVGTRSTTQPYKGALTPMAEITARRRGELVRKVFEVLLQHPDGLPAKAVLEWVERNIPITDYERSDYPNSPGVRRFEKIVRFS